MQDPKIVSQLKKEENELKINVAELPTVSCTTCGGILWDQAILLKRVSPLQSPTGKEEFATLPMLVCLACKTPIVGNQAGKSNTEKQEKPTEKKEENVEK